MKKLSNDGPLGLLSDRDGYFRSEYQVERSLIWVRCSHCLGCKACVAKADAILEEVWAAMPSAVAMAEDYSRTQIPDFWSKHDMSKREGPRLDVWGITITDELSEVVFDISRNHCFDYASPTFSKDDCWDDEPMLLPDLPDMHHVYIVRGKTGQLSLA